MANYDGLKGAIQNNYEWDNGQNKIIGPDVEQCLLALIDSLGVGFQYMGVATPSTDPGTPDQRVFYVASTQGIYPNFNNLSIGEFEVALFVYGDGWEKQATEIPSKTQVLNRLDAQDLNIAQFEAAVRNMVENYPNITIYGNVENAPDGEDLTTKDNKLKFANRPAVGGMGYVILRKENTFEEQLTQENTIYEIRYIFDLDGNDVTIPAGSVLMFNGGTLTNGEIVGQQTMLLGNVRISANVSGSFKNEQLHSSWFLRDDISDVLTERGASGKTLVLDDTKEISQSVVLSSGFKMFGGGTLKLAVSVEGDIFTADNSSDIEIRDISVDYNREVIGDLSVYVFDFFSCQNVSLSRLNIVNTDTTPTPGSYPFFACGTSQNIHICDCITKNTTLFFANKCKNVTAKRNVADYSIGTYIECNSCDNVVIEQNEVVGCYSNVSMISTNSKNTLIAKNKITGSGQEICCVNLGHVTSSPDSPLDADGARVIDNVLICENIGLLIQNATDVVIAHNSITAQRPVFQNPSNATSRFEFVFNTISARNYTGSSYPNDSAIRVSGSFVKFSDNVFNFTQVASPFYIGRDVAGADVIFERNKVVFDTGGSRNFMFQGDVVNFSQNDITGMGNAISYWNVRKMVYNNNVFHGNYLNPYILKSSTISLEYIECVGNNAIDTTYTGYCILRFESNVITDARFSLQSVILKSNRVPNYDSSTILLNGVDVVDTFAFAPAALASIVSSNLAYPGLAVFVTGTTKKPAWYDGTNWIDGAGNIL